MSDKWYFSRGGTEGQGPVTLQDLQAKCTFGDLSPTDLVWHEGMPQWVPAATIPELGFSPTQISPPPPTQSTAQPVQAVPLGTVNYSQPHPDASITCSARTVDLLRQTRPWARFIAVMIFIGSGFMILGGLAMFAGAAFGSGSGPPGFLGLLYLIAAVIYIPAGVYLNRYCSRITQVAALRRDDLLEQAIEAQKSFWKYCAIVMIVTLGLYALAIVVIICGFAFHLF